MQSGNDNGADAHDQIDALDVDPYVARLLALERSVSYLLVMNDKMHRAMMQMHTTVTCTQQRLHTAETTNNILRNNYSVSQAVCAAQAHFLCNEWNNHPEWDAAQAYAESQQFVRSHVSGANKS
jgi:hypothetical protein